jgi:Domain of unknown function (DUF4432)
MPTIVLTDFSTETWVDSLEIDAPALGLGEIQPFSVKKQTLRGGRREGVDMIVVDNGSLRFSIVPTRGMGLWKGWYGGNPLGWDSPITDGPVNPAFVNLAAHGGLGWLEGFDELLARCGLEHNGAPYEVETVKPDGSKSHTTFGLHGRIANIPASYVAVHVDAEHPHEIVVEGHVEETRMFGPQVRMKTRISTVPGSNQLVVRDEFENLKEQPVEMYLLYHWNFGPPFLEPGARFVAPVQTLTPRDATAQAALERYNVYEGPKPGFAEEVYYFKLHEEGGSAPTTKVMLRNQAGDKGVVLEFRTDQLPAFTLWKNTAGLRDGYVTGLEPGTNFPNTRSFEQARNRAVRLPVDGRYVTETTLTVLATAPAVAGVEQEIARLQARGAAKINGHPSEPFALQTLLS